MNPFTLTDGELILRPVRSDDATAIFAACQDPEIQEWTTIPSPYSRSDSEFFVVLTEKAWAENRPVFVLEADGEFAGVVSCNNAVRKGNRVELGFWANPELRGNGYMTRGCAILIDYLFAQGVGAIGWEAEIHHDLLNLPSIRVAQKLGFRLDGRVRASSLNKGVLYDCVVGTLLPDDERIDTAPWPID